VTERIDILLGIKGSNLGNGYIKPRSRSEVSPEKWETRSA